MMPSIHKERITNKDTYLLIDNDYLINGKLSMDGIALLTYMFNFPINYDFNLDRVCCHLQCTRERLRKTLNELIDTGYLAITREKNPLGHFEYHYYLKETIKEYPESLKVYENNWRQDLIFYTNPGIENPFLENPGRGNPGRGNPGRSNPRNGNPGRGIPDTGIGQPCNNKIINNKIININKINKNAFSSKEENSCASLENSSSLENNKLNLNLISAAEQVGTKPKKIKNKLQAMELEKEKNGGDISVSSMIMSTVGDLSASDNEIAQMKRTMNVINETQQEIRTRDKKRTRQKKLILQMIDETVTNSKLNNKWKEFVQMWDEKNYGLSKTSFTALKKKAESLSTDPDTLCNMLEQSIVKGWRDIYEVSEDFKKKTTYTPIKQTTEEVECTFDDIARDENGNPIYF